ncbi:hypothetical protein ACJDT4_06110 [Clostridium neuense]|uniref:DUF304 domain-containing protein n=1 Tax=Clostridium neuense TaxID=1728934 RepID=A0ABW8TCB3_9CLOT
MENNIKTFTSKNSYKSLVADAGLVLLTVLANLKDKFSMLGIIFMAVVVIYVIFDITCTIYRYKMTKHKKIPDLAIDSEKVIIYSGFPVKKTEIKFSEMESIFVPKWDRLIEIKLKNKTKANINLATYSHEDATEIKNIFNEIQARVILKDFGKKDKPKTYHNVNGKCYTK